jgi:hypothetical protein
MVRSTLALILIALIADQQSVFAQAAQQAAATPAAAPASAAAQPAAPADAALPPEQLESLVAPIALYPDPLLSQTLVASTYPLEVVQLQQWLGQHKDLKDQALVDAVKKQDWDPSIQSLAALPDVTKLLAENIKWTTDLGNAFLAQQADVMDAVQRMRKKAQDKGSLKTTEQQKVETQVVEQKQVIVIEQANPQVIYVPTYNPTVVYPPPVYAYPPVVYPPYYGVGMAFTAGIIMGAAFSGGWGYNCGWGSSNVNINVNNNFVNNSNRNQVNGGGRNQVNNGGRGGNNSWQHNPSHRGGAPYGDRKTASQYGGTARGDSASTREASARNQQSQRGPSAGTSDRGASGGADRGPSAGTSDRGASGGADRGPSAGTSDRGGGGADRGASAGNRGSAGGGDHVGNRSVPSSPSSSNRSAFGGSNSGSSARASSSRGGSSMRGGGGGGGRRR